MENSIKKFFGILAAIVIVLIKVIVRIPVALVLFVAMVVYLLIIAPIKGEEDSPRWLSRLYDWYCGK